MSARPDQPVVIAGGGIAAMEMLLALRALAPADLEIVVVAPESEHALPPLSVGEPFGAAHPNSYSIERIAAENRAGLIEDSVTVVNAEDRSVKLGLGGEQRFSQLVIAVGASLTPAFDGVITVGEDDASEKIAGALDDLEREFSHRIAFVVPPGVGWTMPLYEVAVMTARDVWGLGISAAQIAIITPEERPLGIFGPPIASAIEKLLSDEGIEFFGNSYPEVHSDGVRLKPGGEFWSAHRIVSLPHWIGPTISGVPQDRNGFIATDDFGRVIGLPDVYAAGDATSFPVKQGGLAAQQADAVAAHISSLMNADITPEPFRSVLRGIFFTGGKVQFMRTDIAGGSGEGRISLNALWWPPGKIAGKYLAPYLYGIEHGSVEPEGEHLEVELTLRDNPTRY